MRQVSVSILISAPREQVYDFVADLAGRPAYTDHYLKDYRLARANAYGKGAAARFLLDAPLGSERGEFSIKEAERPRRILEEGRIGRLAARAWWRCTSSFPSPAALAWSSPPSAIRPR